MPQNTTATDDGCVAGIDVGTSGVRVAVLDADGAVAAFAGEPMPPPVKDGPSVTQDPEIWWHAAQVALNRALMGFDASRLKALAVDGTSGTILAIDRAGVPIAPALMYNDASAVEAARVIAREAPPETAAHGASSALGRAVGLLERRPFCFLHQADWIAGRLTGQFQLSDENNALKTGYDPVARRWPDWIAACGMDTGLLPRVLPVGSAFGTVAPTVASRFGLRPDTVVFAGTTDGCAAFLATGADQVGDGVTSLGTTLVLKLLSDTPIFAPAFGIYSHRIGAMWLPGGASNAGGAALLQHFTVDRMKALEPALDPDRPTGLDFYPLPAPGERFPVNDPALQPRVSPRPADDALFLQALLEGIAGVEALGYRRLAELGAPALGSVRTVGGGARNAAWSRMRERLLGVPLLQPLSDEAAVGSARIARVGLAGGFEP
jgi:sugar (pentulose or hexulose) kinase